MTPVISLAENPSSRDLFLATKEQAESGKVEAQLALGNMFNDGEGVTQYHAHAGKWFQKAAMAGNPAAQMALGKLYAGGGGIPKNNIEAYVWFSIAAISESTLISLNASTALNKVEQKLKPAEVAEAQARATQKYARLNP